MSIGLDGEWFDQSLVNERQIGDSFITPEVPLPTETDPGVFIRKDIVTSKGDLIAGTVAGAVARQPAGSNGQVVTYDNTTTTGLKATTPFSVSLPLSIANGGTSATTVAGVLAALGIAKQNAAASSPGVNDDNTQGYSVNSLWTDTNVSRTYVCQDATTGAAVWTQIAP